MAEINIERKKNEKPIWPWIVGLLLLVGIVWGVSEIDENPIAEVTEQQTVLNPGEVEEPEEPGLSDINESEEAEMRESEEAESFVGYINSADTKEQMGVDHEVTSEALVKLSASLKAISEDNQFEEEINQIEEHARQIKENPESLQHAELVNDAFTNAANVMEQIQTTRFPDAQSDVKEVQDMATQIREDKELLNQKENVQAFFKEAAEAVETMKSNNSGDSM